MELGEKLLQARKAAGLSQRQLCGDTITRNMLSQIEHGTARPSMGTLRILAERLGKPVSYFLDEQILATPNEPLMRQAWEAYDTGDYSQVITLLQTFQEPDEIFFREKDLLLNLSRLYLAEQVMAAGKHAYARELLEQSSQTQWVIPGLARQRGILLAKLTGDGSALPEIDEELYIRAKAAFASGFYGRSLHLLEAMENHTGPDWHLLRGDLYRQAKDYSQAARCYHRAEEVYPRETAIRLEHCYRELEDYKQAYFYACKQKK